MELRIIEYKPITLFAITKSVKIIKKIKGLIAAHFIMMEIQPLFAMPF
jgi:hypothetical protein